MAKKGTFTLPANFHVKIQEPIDDRGVKKTKADLILLDTWPHDGDTIYVYNNMLVSTDEGIFKLKDKTKILEKDFSGWELVSGPKVVDNLSSDSAEEALSAKQGKILKAEISELEKTVSQANTWKIFE